MDAKILLLDIEATNLAANFGYILCISYKYFGEKKVMTIKISDSPSFNKDPTNDKWIVKEISKVINDSDMVVTWYGSKFDIPFIQTRLLGHRLPPLPSIPHIDGWRIAKYKMKLNSNRLASVSEFLGLENKTPLTGTIWVKASAGNKKALNYIVNHCEQDVIVLEQAYDLIRSLCTTHPNVNLVKGKLASCPVCGSNKLQKRGFNIARTRKSQRYQCRSCGSWSSGKSVKTSVEVR